MDEIFGEQGNSGGGENSGVIGPEGEEGVREVDVFTEQECMCFGFGVGFCFCVFL